MELQFCSVVRITSWSTPSCHFVFRAQCATVITDRWDNNVWQSSLDSWHSNSRWQARTGYHRDNKCIRNGWKTNVARMSQSTTTKPAPSSCITRIPWRLFIYTRNANSRNAKFWPSRFITSKLNETLQPWSEFLLSLFLIKYSSILTSDFIRSYSNFIPSHILIRFDLK